MIFCFLSVCYVDIKQLCKNRVTTRIFANHAFISIPIYSIDCTVIYVLITYSFSNNECQIHATHFESRKYPRSYLSTKLSPPPLTSSSCYHDHRQIRCLNHPIRNCFPSSTLIAEIDTVTSSAPRLIIDLVRFVLCGQSPL